MTQVLIKQILGNVEILDGGKIIPAKKGVQVSLEAKIKTGSNGKVEIEVNGQTYVIPKDQDVIIKNIISMNGGNSSPTKAGGVRG